MKTALPPEAMPRHRFVAAPPPHPGPGSSDCDADPIRHGPGSVLPASAMPGSSLTGTCSHQLPTDLQEPDELRGSPPVRGSREVRFPPATRRTPSTSQQRQRAHRVPPSRRLPTPPRGTRSSARGCAPPRLPHAGAGWRAPPGQPLALPPPLQGAPMAGLPRRPAWCRAGRSRGPRQERLTPCSQIRRLDDGCGLPALEGPTTLLIIRMVAATAPDSQPLVGVDGPAGRPSVRRQACRGPLAAADAITLEKPARTRMQRMFSPRCRAGITNWTT